MQKWKKLGLIFRPLENKNSFSHCQHPTPLKLSNSIYRIFYGSRNVNNLTQVFYFDFNIDSFKILSYSKNPILKLGDTGFFDQHGIYPSSIIEDRGKALLYTIGFTQGCRPLYYTRIGLAISIDKELELKKYSIAPIINISEYDPCTVTGPFVLKENGQYRMWYVSGYKWDEDQDGSLQSFYNIKYAESKDGIEWKRNGLISIAHAYPEETNIARPWILKEKDIYKAWFSYNCGKEGYRIGYAESRDGGYVFERMDHLVGLTVSEEPWENEAICYPAVIIHNDKKYMFYNGNKFGKDGIALAVED